MNSIFVRVVIEIGEVKQEYNDESEEMESSYDVKHTARELIQLTSMKGDTEKLMEQ